MIVWANWSLRQVEFLYYDYSEETVHANKYFFDPPWEQSYINKLEAQIFVWNINIEKLISIAAIGVIVYYLFFTKLTSFGEV